MRAAPPGRQSGALNVSATLKRLLKMSHSLLGLTRLSINAHLTVELKDFQDFHRFFGFKDFLARENKSRRRSGGFRPIVARL